MQPGLVLLASLLCCATHTGFVRATSGPEPNCCLQASNTQVPVGRVVNYTIQAEGSCPIRAVLFLTVRNKTLCSDPNGAWAQRAILKVDERRDALLNKGQAEAPAAAAPASTRRAGRRTGRRRTRIKSRRGKKGQKKKAKQSRQ